MQTELELFLGSHTQAPQLNVRVFKTNSDKISIVPITDLHYGARKHNAPLLRQYLSYIMNTPDCYAIGLGDYMENATRTSVGLGMYEEDIHFPQQYERLEEMLRPLAQAGKLLGLHTGNHEMRATLATGMDPVYMLAKSLCVPYLGYTAFHKWVVGDVTYKVLTVHGRSAARSPSGRLNALRNLRDIVQADIYMMGHLHDRQVHKEAVYTIDDTDDSVKTACRYYIITGSLLDWPESYADMMAMPPVRTGLVKIDLYSQVKVVDVKF
jgi:hypothetical protein